jgi:hypothetical protein
LGKSEALDGCSEGLRVEAGVGKELLGEGGSRGGERGKGFCGLGV